MNKRLAVAALAMMTLFGCAYGGVSAVGNSHVVIARNDGLLFGILRKVYVCKVSATGLSGCVEGSSP